MTHDDVRDLAAAFVLGALEADEEQAVREHLATCSEPHPEFEELGSVVPALALAIDPVEPSAALRGRILAAAALDLAERQSGQTAERSAPTPSAEQIVDLAVARTAGRLSRVAWVMGLAAVIAIAALGAWNLSLRSDLDAAAAYRQHVDAVLAAAAKPNSSSAILTSKDDPGRSGLAVVAADGSVQIVVRGLAATAGGHVYEAWVIAAGTDPKPVGSFTVAADGTGYLVAPTAGGAAGDTVALTLEPGPGATVPTPPIISAGVAGT